MLSRGIPWNFLRIHTPLKARVYTENTSDVWHIPTRKHCITSMYCIVLYYIVSLYCIILHVFYLLYRIVSYCICIVLYCIVLYYITCIVSYCIVPC